MSEDALVEELQSGGAALDLELSVAQAARLAGYARLLQRWNDKFNLVSRRDAGRLLSRHLLDSLSIGRWLWGERIVDIGSGAGLPGIPLAIVNPDRHFVLVDRSERKARFLGQVVMSFDLDNVEVRCADARALEVPQRFTTIVCRAVSGLPDMWKIARPLLADSGRLVFMSSTDARCEGSAGNGEFDLPADANVVRERVLIPGLPTPHEVLIVEGRA